MQLKYKCSIYYYKYAKDSVEYTFEFKNSVITVRLSILNPIKEAITETVCHYKRSYDPIDPRPVLDKEETITINPDDFPVFLHEFWDDGKYSQKIFCRRKDFDELATQRERDDLTHKMMFHRDVIVKYLKENYGANKLEIAKLFESDKIYETGWIDEC